MRPLSLRGEAVHPVQKQRQRRREGRRSALIGYGDDGGVPVDRRAGHPEGFGDLGGALAAGETCGGGGALVGVHEEAVERLYSALGRRLHYENAGPDTVTLATAVAEAQLPADLVDAVEDSSLDTVVRASHDEAQARVGTETGSPVTAVDGGPGFFGPVVAPVPEGADADRLFEALRLLSAVPQFSELKRARIPF